jgi:hypothetical protein
VAHRSGWIARSLAVTVNGWIMAALVLGLWADDLRTTAMSAFFVFELLHVATILRGLRLLLAAEPNNKDIDGTICWLKQQIVGKIKHFEPFMRNRKWIEDEITFEGRQDTDCHYCAEPTCNKLCRGTFCSDCWRELLSEIHGEPGHTESECKKA